MRRALAALALWAALVPAWSCAPAKRAPPPVQQLVFWAPWPAEVLGPVLAGFEKEHPGLRVRVEDMPDSVRARRIAAATPGELPDLCAIGTEDMPGLLAGGRLADWSAGVADLRPVLRGWESCSVGDALYGVPWLLAPRVLYWNPGLFARARMDPGAPPRTWDDLERAAARLRRLGRGVYGYGVPTGPDGLVDGVLPFLASAGAGILSEDRRHAVFDSAASVRAVQLLVRLRRAGMLAPQDSLERAFAAGRLGMLLSGPWLLRTPSVAVAVAAVPHPEADSVAASWATGEVLVSFNGSRRRHEALELARFLSAPEPAADVARRTGVAVPATADAETTAAVRRRPGIAKMVGQLAGCRYAPAHPAWRAMKDSLAAAVEDALRGRKTPERAVADAQAQLEEILGR